MLFINEISVSEIILLIIWWKLDMSEWEESHFTIQLTFPLTIDIHFSHFDNITDLKF